MIQTEEYLLRAGELSAKAQAETDHTRKVDIENLARAYLRLAERPNVKAIRTSSTRRRQKGLRPSLRSSRGNDEA
jgi:hypothetical protein